MCEMCDYQSSMSGHFRTNSLINESELDRICNIIYRQSDQIISTHTVYLLECREVRINANRIESRLYVPRETIIVV